MIHHHVSVHTRHGIHVLLAVATVFLLSLPQQLVPGLYVLLFNLVQIALFLIVGSGDSLHVLVHPPGHVLIVLIEELFVLVFPSLL